MGHRFASRHWYRCSILSLLLLPAAAVFGILVTLRRMLYRCGLLRKVRIPVPVVVIGNLVVGGTGKTPLVLWMCKWMAMQGRRPGVVLRGYGARSPAPRRVTAKDCALDTGDEALLLAGNAGCPVWIGRERVAAAKSLLGAHPDCDLLICDDGLQHYRMGRDLEIAVEDERGHGNGFLLPAGPLREPSSRAVDATVVTVAGGVNKQGAAQRAGPVFRMRLEPVGVERLDGSAASLAELSGLPAGRLHAVAGIGNPQRFFNTLGALGLAFVPHSFPDHHRFQRTDLDFADCDAVVMTEKDAVKCRSFERRDVFVLRVAASPDSGFADFLLKALDGFKTA